MKDKKIVIYNDKVSPALVGTLVVKYTLPNNKEFTRLFESVEWERTPSRINLNRKHSTFAISLYFNNEIVGMGRVCGDGSYFTIYDIVMHKDYQKLGFGSIILTEIIDWYKSIKDDDTYLYLGASKGKEKFYEKFGFKSRPNDDVGAGMKWYE